MYYTFNCTYCGRVFYTYNSNKEIATQILYKAVRKHLIEYDEDSKENEMDDGEKEDTDQIYYEMKELNEPPLGGYDAENT